MSKPRFDKQFFLTHQRILVWFCNAPVIGRLVRYAFSMDGVGVVVNIYPNSVHWHHGRGFKAQFYSTDAYAKRLYELLYPLWALLGYTQPYHAFSKDFFTKHQETLLWLCRFRWFRYIMRIIPSHSSIGDREVRRISPNAIWWEEDGQYVAEFRTHPKYAKRLYYGFAPIWWAMHVWDWVIADRWIPRWSFGFNTLQEFPDADTESTSVDGTAEHWGTEPDGDPWSTIRGAAGNVAHDNDTNRHVHAIWSGTTTNYWVAILRSFFLFDTSALTSSANISKSVMGLYGYSKYDDYDPAIAPSTNIYTSNPASNTAIVAGDYDSLGDVAQCDTAITYANWNTAGWNDFLLNSTGRGNISKTGVTKFGGRSANYDAANSAPTWSASHEANVYSYQADETGDIEAYDPRLLVTYTLPATSSPYTVYTDLYPAASAASGPVHRAGYNESWSSVRTGGGNYAGYDETGSHSAVWFETSGDTDYWWRLRRYVAFFDTSAIGSGRIVSAATVYVYGAEKANNLGNSIGVNVYGITTSSTTSLANSDYENCGSTAFSTEIAYGDFSITGYNAWALNATGIAAVSTIGLTKFSWRNPYYDVSGNTPTWGAANQSDRLYFYYAGNDLSHDPKLVVTYAFGTYTDNFNRSNETPLGGNWTCISGQEINLSSNQIVPGDTVWDRYAFRNSEAYLSDHYSQMKITSTVASVEVGGPAVRCSSNGGVFNGYYASINNTTTIQVWAFWGATPTNEQVGTDISGTFASGDILRLQIVGQVLSVYQNGVLIGTRTDSNNRVTSGGTAGVMIRASGTSWDDWEGGHIPTEGSTCWGHATGVSEANVRTIASNWLGTGDFTGSGNSEQAVLVSGEYLESEVIDTGIRHVTLAQNVYASGDTAVLKYRHGASVAACLAASWSTYSGAFESAGYVQIRIEN